MSLHSLTRFLIPALLLVGVSFGTTGCFLVAAGAGGAGGYAYAKGATRYNIDAPHEKVHAAAVAACEEMSLEVREKNVDATAGMIRGKTADGKEFTIKSDRFTDTSSELVIRVLPFGDAQVQQLIHDKIQAKL